MVRTRLNIGCRYSTPVLERPLHPTRSQFKPQPSQTQAPVTPATEPERRAGGGLTTVSASGPASSPGVLRRILSPSACSSGPCERSRWNDPLDRHDLPVRQNKNRAAGPVHCRIDTGLLHRSRSEPPMRPEFATACMMRLRRLVDLCGLQYTSCPSGHDPNGAPCHQRPQLRSDASAPAPAHVASC